MMRTGKKYHYKESRFVNKGKRAYVDFWAFDENTESLKRKQVFCPTNVTGVARERWGKNTTQRINELLESGFHFGKVLEPVPGTNTQTPGPDTLLLEALKEALPIKLSELRGTSKDSYQTVVRKFETYLKSKGLEEIKAANFNKSRLIEYRAYLINSLGNVNRTANNNIIFLGSLFGIMKDLKLIETNPFEGFKGLAETDTETHEVFTREHQSIIENWLIENDPVLYLFTRFQYHAFIRPKEIRGLLVKDIDLKRRTINVRSTIAKNKKNGIVPINQTLYQDFTSVLSATNSHQQNSLIFGGTLQLFHKRPLSENYAYERHKKALVSCHLIGFNYTLYSWKHTGACRALEAGVNVRKLQGLLRHSSLEETDRYLRSLGIALQNEELKECW